MMGHLMHLLIDITLCIESRIFPICLCISLVLVASSDIPNEVSFLFFPLPFLLLFL